MLLPTQWPAGNNFRGPTVRSLDWFPRLVKSEDFLRGKGVAEKLQLGRRFAVRPGAVEALANASAQDQRGLIGQVGRLREIRYRSAPST